MSAEHTGPSLAVKAENNSFTIRDQDGNVYGTYGTHADAESAMSDWIKYYREIIVS